MGAGQQELMRHSDIGLTMNTYTHLQLIDTAGAVEAIPSIGDARQETAQQVATGTDGPVIGDRIGAGRQAAADHSWQPLAKRNAPTARRESPQVFSPA